MQNNQNRLSWLSLGAVTSASFGGIWLTRDQIMARFFELPPATHELSVQRGVQIRMPDGEVLAHEHFRPKSDIPLPTILIRTPYGRGRTSFTGFFKQILVQQYALRGYHVILQDTRGRYGSTGTFEPYINEPDDGAATIDWIVRQPWSDGQIGMTGQSYVGFVQYAAAARDDNKHIKALFPIITQARLGSLPEHAYPLDLALRWLLFLDAQQGDHSIWERLRRLSNVTYQNQLLAPGFDKRPMSEAPKAIFGRTEPIFENWLLHPDEDDPYWAALDHRATVKDAPPAHFIAGWHDLFLVGQLQDYQQQVAADRNPYLTIGSWTHLDIGNQASTLGESLRWFDKHLKGIDNVRAKPVRLMLMGANEWHDYDQWPPTAAETAYFLRADGSLNTAKPAPLGTPSRYRYDPHDPTPNLGGALLSVEAGSVDNRKLESRADVLTFTTAALVSDADLIGYPKLELFVQTSAASTDFFGRLCDVHPDGKSYNVCDALYRLKPERDETGADGVYRLTFELAPTAYRFKAGHRIRLQVSGGAFPRYQRNFGTDEDFMYAEKMIAGDQIIYHDTGHPSSVTLPIV